MNSYGLWIATEINEHYDSDDSRSSFIKVAFGRQVAAIKPMILWDLNPCNPNHKIYRSYIDKYKEKYLGGYQYQHFTLKDNLSITPQRRAEIISQYEKDSIWYRRDIKGERCIAEGLVFAKWENALCEPIQGRASEYVLSIDYGTQNAFAGCLWGKYGNVWYLTKEYYYSGREEHKQKEDSEYLKDLNDFVAPIVREGVRIRTIIDPSAASFKVTLRKSPNRWYRPIDADNAVADGIREVNTAIDLGLIKVFNTCKNWQMEAGGYAWDTKADEDKPIKVNDHCLTGDTLVMTEYGAKPIKELVGTSGNVWSYNIDTGVAELKPYYDCRMTQEEAEIYEIETEDGRFIRCTGEHPILTERGYVLTKDLLVSDRIIDIVDSLSL